jgi:hypothetical protein
LGGDVGDDLAVVIIGDGKTERDGGVDMGVGAAEQLGDEDTSQHGERPAGGDHDPAGVLGLRLVQQDPGDNPIAQQNEDERA